MAVAASSSQAVPAPDGGWGWMVVLGSFLIHLFADGMAYSYGVYVIPLVVEFDVTHSEVGMLGSLLIGVTWGTGPLASVLVNRFGCRATAIGGILIASFGFFISIFAPNIYFMYVSFGIIAGAGLGMAYLPSIVAVSFYFEKRRSLATGLAVCGSGIGTFVFAPMTDALVEEYGWKGSLLIETGILLNCIACGAVFRPMSDLERTHRKKELKKAADTKAVLTVPDIVVKDSITSNNLKVMNPNSNVRSASTLGINSVNLSLQNIIPDPRCRSTQAVNVQAESDKHGSAIKKAPSKSNLNPMDRKDVLYPASLTNIPLYTSNKELYMRTISKTADEELDEVDNNRNKSEKPAKLLEWSLMCDLCFFLFFISNFLTSLGVCVPYIYLPDRSVKQLETDGAQGALLLSVLGIGNMIGRIAFGFIADVKCVNRLMLYNTVLIICGVSSMLSALCFTYPTLALYSTTFGVLMGAYVCLTPVVLVDLLGLDKLSDAFGLLLLSQGIGAVVGPPIAGAIYDLTKDYNNSFHLMGVCIFISGAMLYPIPLIQRCLNKRLTAKEAALGKKSAVQDKNGEAIHSEELQRIAS